MNEPSKEKRSKECAMEGRDEKNSCKKKKERQDLLLKSGKCIIIEDQESLKKEGIFEYSGHSKSIHAAKKSTKNIDSEYDSKAISFHKLS